MSRGEFLTRITIWLSLAGYAAGASTYILSRGRRRWDETARFAWTIGCASLLAHVTCAMGYYHNWSQASALRETARQTAELTGIEWGGGLYINYALLIGWVIDVAWWRWGGLNAYRNRSLWITAAWHGFLIFIVFNATVVFKTGALRWIGLGLCLWLAFLWLLVNRNVASGRSEGNPIFKE
jgi:hypothetical protein